MGGEKLGSRMGVMGNTRRHLGIMAQILGTRWAFLAVR
jgi:hypothetical protein